MKRICLYQILLVAAVMATGVIYAPSLHYPFVWDDMAVVRDNPYLRTGDYSPVIFFRPVYWRKMLPISRFDYRPFQMIALSILSRVGGRAPFLFRATNLFLHLFICWLIWRLMFRLGADHRAALLAAAFFALHPVHVETVVNARNIAELLMVLLLLASFIIFLRPKSPASLVISLLCFMAAILCKESALILPVLLTVTVLLLKKEPADGVGIGRTIPFWLIAGAGTAVKLLISPGGPVHDPPELPAFIVGSSRLLGIYLRLLLLPARLKVLYSFNKPLSWAVQGWFLPLLATTGALLAGTRVFKKNRRLFWALSCLAVSLLPTLGKIGQVGRIVAEQRLYLPSVFFCIAGAFILDPAGCRSRRRLFAVTGIAALLVCLFFAGLIGEYLPSWQSNLALWTRVTSLSPGVSLAHNNLAIAYHRQGDNDRALEELKTALRIKPGNKEAHSNIGLLHGRAGRWEEAIEEFRWSLKTDPSYYPASLHLAKAYLRTGRVEEAEEALRGVLEQNPYLAKACNGMAIVMEKKSQPREAEKLYRKAAELNPEYAMPLRNLTALYYEEKQYDLAIDAGREAIRRSPDHPKGYLKLARVYITMGRFDEARGLLEEATRRNPQDRKIKSLLMALDSSPSRVE